VLALGAHEGKTAGVQPVDSARALARHLTAHTALGFLAHVHISGHTPKSWAIAAAVAALRSPLSPAPVLTIHSGLVPGLLAMGEGYRAMARAVCWAYGRVFVVNPIIERALRDAGVGAARLTVAPAATGPVVAGRPPPALADLRSQHEPLIACAVAPGPIYGAKALLASLPVLVARMPRVGLVLYGPGPTEPLRNLARHNEVEERVVLLGELSHLDALGAVSACDLFVRPTLADGDALSVREALALGKPVVATRVGCRPAGTHLYTVGDPLELAQQVELAWREPPEPSRGPRDELEPVLEAYRQLVGRGAGAGQRAAAEEA
jgi:hypothetical protein